LPGGIYLRGFIGLWFNCLLVLLGILFPAEPFIGLSLDRLKDRFFLDNRRGRTFSGWATIRDKAAAAQNSCPVSFNEIVFIGPPL